MSLQKTRESGRSMVEMLGVLAIIGVLSIAGIYGYSIAMAKHRANEVAYQVSIAHVAMVEAAAMEKQGEFSSPLPSGSSVDLEDINIGTGYPNGAIRAKFDNDIEACKQFYQMYQNNPNFKAVNRCDN